MRTYPREGFFSTGSKIKIKIIQQSNFCAELLLSKIKCTDDKHLENYVPKKKNFSLKEFPQRQGCNLSLRQKNIIIEQTPSVFITIDDYQKNFRITKKNLWPIDRGWGKGKCLTKFLYLGHLEVGKSWFVIFVFKLSLFFLLTLSSIFCPFFGWLLRMNELSW